VREKREERREDLTQRAPRKSTEVTEKRAATRGKEQASI
jgi:hypothetical protein